MKKSGVSAKGFTLIELTIVVSIIGVLSALAIPAFMKFIAKAKQTEAKGMLTSIAAYEYDYKLRHGKYIACGKDPVKSARDQWDPKVAGWAELGFEPLGSLRYQYEVKLEGESFVIRAEGNIDADDTLDRWQLTGKDMKLLNPQNDVQN